MQGAQVQSLVWELRSHMPRALQPKSIKQKWHCNKFNTDFKKQSTLKKKIFKNKIKRLAFHAGPIYFWSTVLRNRCQYKGLGSLACVPETREQMSFRSLGWILTHKLSLLSFAAKWAGGGVRGHLGLLALQDGCGDHNLIKSEAPHTSKAFLWAVRKDTRHQQTPLTNQTLYLGWFLLPHLCFANYYLYT